MIHALIFLSLLSQSYAIEAQPSSGIIYSPHLMVDRENDQPVCKVPDANEYEPCAWQDERAAEEERKATQERETKVAKAKCAAGGCLVVRQSSNFVYSTSPPTYPPDWRCDCKAKPRPAKGAQKK